MDTVNSWGSMRIILIVLLTLCCSCKGEWFAHDRAAYDAQHQDWANALQRLNTSLIDHPDDPSLLYDAGVVTYKSGDYKQAADYFKRATHAKSIELSLQKQAYFNLGNSHSALKQYKEAVAAYEAALKLDPTDERVRHNLKKARELLKAEEQKKQEQQKQDGQSQQDKSQQNQQDKDKQQQQNDQQKNDQKQDQQKQDGQNQQDKSQQNQQDKQAGQQEQKSGQDNKSGSGTEKSQEQQSQNKQKQEQNGTNSGNDQKRDGGNKNQQQQSNDSGADRGQQEEQGGSSKKPDHKPGDHGNNDKKQGQGDQGQQQQSDRKPAGGKGNDSESAAREQTFDDHGQSPTDQGQQLGQQQSSQQNDTQSGLPAQAMQVQQGKKQAQIGTQEPEGKKVDKHLMWIMEEQERNDAQRSKGLIKGVIGKQLVGQDGQHCW